MTHDRYLAYSLARPRTRLVWRCMRGGVRSYAGPRLFVVFQLKEYFQVRRTGYGFLTLESALLVAGRALLLAREASFTGF
jgi:hypothetical protein